MAYKKGITLISNEFKSGLGIELDEEALEYFKVDV